jgi:mRNA interferase MazF
VLYYYHSVLDRRANVSVAEVTRVVRNLPCEVPLYASEGMPVDCVINTDNLHTIPKDRLREKIIDLPEDRIFELTQALRFSLDLEW